MTIRNASGGEFHIGMLVTIDNPTFTRVSTIHQYLQGQQGRITSIADLHERGVIEIGLDSGRLITVPWNIVLKD